MDSIQEELLWKRTLAIGSRTVTMPVVALALRKQVSESKNRWGKRFGRPTDRNSLSHV